MSTEYIQKRIRLNALAKRRYKQTHQAKRDQWLNKKADELGDNYTPRQDKSHYFGNGKQTEQPTVSYDAFTTNFARQA